MYDTHTHTHVCVTSEMCVCNTASHLLYKFNQSGVNSCVRSIRNKSKQSTASHPTLQYGFLIKELQWNHTTFWFGLRNLYFIKRLNFCVTYSLSARKASAGTFSFLLTAKQGTLKSLKQFTSLESNSCSEGRIVRRRNLRYSELW